MPSIEEDVAMTRLRQRMIEDMQLRGFAEKTQEAYLRCVGQLAAYYGKSPEGISEEELRQYFLYLKNEKKASRSACTQALREVVELEVRDLDSDRMMVHVRQGEGGKDRYVPLPDRTLALLRQSWVGHQHPRWLFPAST